MPDIDHYLTRRVALEVASHEACVLEAYLDSENVWTWGFGLTVASGHNPMRYRRKPATLERCVEVYIWALRRYAREVLDAFAGHELTPAQFSAALSFHWNTGKIRTASWVAAWKRGDMKAASAGFLAYRIPASIIKRRKKEHDLFFRGRWSGTGRITIWGVLPSGKVNWKDARTVDIGPALDRALGWPAGDGTIRDSEPADTRDQDGGDEPAAPLPADGADKPVSRSTRFWTWLTTGGGTALLPFVDWRVQLVLVVGILGLSIYAIVTMPAVRAKLARLLGLSE
jgi:lysozyme